MEVCGHPLELQVTIFLVCSGDNFFDNELGYVYGKPWDAIDK